MKTLFLSLFLGIACLVNAQNSFTATNLEKSQNIGEDWVDTPAEPNNSKFTITSDYTYLIHEEGNQITTYKFTDVKYDAEKDRIVGNLRKANTKEKYEVIINLGYEYMSFYYDDEDDIYTNLSYDFTFDNGKLPIPN